MSINESVRLNVLCDADQALDRISTFSMEREHECLFLHMNNEEGCNLVLEQLAKTQYSNLRVIKIFHTVLCAYKKELTNPEGFYQRLWRSRVQNLTYTKTQK